MSITPPPLALASELLTAIQLGPLMVAVVLYARRAHTLALNRRPVPGWRQICFYAGLLVSAAAVISLGKAGHEPLFVRMIAQLALGDVAALLIVLGLTAAVIAPILAISVFDRLRVLANPLLAFPLWLIVFGLWRLPVFYEAALSHDGVQVLEQALFLGCGVNLWMCLVGPLPMPAWFGNLGKVLYILAVRLGGAALGNVFLWSGVVFYPYYLQSDSLRHISPIADQNIAGAVMLIEECLLTIGLFCWLFLKTARESEERRDLLDYATRHGVALSEQRAARAIAAGRGGDLRKRLELRIETSGSANPAAREDLGEPSR